MACLKDHPKTQIAARLGLSRFKVARLLEQAREEGLVRITILDGVIRDGQLSERLAQHLKLDHTIVVAGTEAENRKALAQAAASYVRRTVNPGDVSGFSWGRTLAKIGAFMELLPESTLVALTRSVGTDFEQSPVEVLGVAGGLDKVPAIAAVARSRLINTLITDERTARALLELEPVAPGPRQPPGQTS